MQFNPRPYLGAIALLSVLANPAQLAAQLQPLNPLPLAARFTGSLLPQINQPTPFRVLRMGVASKRADATSGWGRAHRAHATPAGWPTSYGVPEELTLNLRIYNYARVAPHLLKQAEEEADRVFDEIGVRTTWIDCPTHSAELEFYPDCGRPVSHEDLMVGIVSGAIPKSVAHAEALGIAHISPHTDCSRYARVFYDRVEERSAVVGVSPELVLGPIMVHEAGHLLLGMDSHTPTGIMKAKWDDRGLQAMAQQAFGFTDDQTRRLRLNLAERMNWDESGEDDPANDPCTSGVTPP
jgi:hypothetical protein